MAINSQVYTKIIFAFIFIDKIPSIDLGNLFNNAYTMFACYYTFWP